MNKPAKRHTSTNSGRPDKPTTNGRKLTAIALVSVAVVAVALLIAIAMSDSPATTQDTTTSVATSTQDTPVSVTPAPKRETGPVTVQGAALPPYDPEQPDPAIGQEGPTLAGITFDGSPTTIDPGNGRATLITFGAHWCPHCQREFPEIITWINSGTVPDNLDIYAVVTGTNETSPNYPPSRWLETIGWNEPVLVDSTDNQARDAYGGTGYPFLVLLDAQGNVTKRWVGTFDKDEITELVAGN